MEVLYTCSSVFFLLLLSIKVNKLYTSSYLAVNPEMLFFNKIELFITYIYFYTYISLKLQFADLLIIILRRLASEDVSMLWKGHNMGYMRTGFSKTGYRILLYRNNFFYMGQYCANRLILIIFFYVLSFFLDNFHSPGMVSH